MNQFKSFSIISLYSIVRSKIYIPMYVRVRNRRMKILSCLRACVYSLACIKFLQFAVMCLSVKGMESRPVGFRL